MIARTVQRTTLVLAAVKCAITLFVIDEIIRLAKQTFVRLSIFSFIETDAQKTYAGMRIEPDVEAVSLARRDAFSVVQENFPELGQTCDLVARKVGLGSGRNASARTFRHYGACVPTIRKRWI
jgi:hypothetical protein